MMQTCRKGEATTRKKEVNIPNNLFKARLDEGSDNTIKLFAKTALTLPGWSHGERDFKKQEKKSIVGFNRV
jgi:hypothetical protein